MTGGSGPWREREPPARPEEPGRGRTGFWLLLMAGVGGLVLALFRAFPDAIRDGNDWANLAYAAGLVALVSTGVFRLGRGAFAQHLKYAAIWSVIIAVLALGFAYRDVFQDTSRRLRLAFSDGSPVALSERELVIPQDRSGIYAVMG